jgi:hypothetical protein
MFHPIETGVARHVVNFMQALALLLILGQVTILFGLNISQVRFLSTLTPLTA